jgi:hypothetical protein
MPQKDMSCGAAGAAIDIDQGTRIPLRVISAENKT